MSGKKIKIIQLISSIDLGGAENVAFNISEHCRLKNPDFEFTVVEVYHSKNPYAEKKRLELERKNISTKTLYRGSKRLSLIFGFIALVSIIRRSKPDIIHAHTDIPDFVLSIALRVLKLLNINSPRIIRTIHNTELWPTHKFIGKITESSFYNDTIIGVSEVSFNAYINIRKQNKLSITENKRIIYNGCKIPQNETIEIPLNSKKINIAFCGRFEYQKGVDVLIERLKEINIKFENKIDFHIIGSGKYNSMLKQLEQSYSNINVYPPIENIASKLHAFDFLLMPSRFEGLVLLSIEASLAKLPVIAAYAPGLSETLPPDWQLNFSLNDPRSLLNIIENIVANNYNITELRQKAYDFASINFALDKMITEYTNTYNSLT